MQLYPCFTSRLFLQLEPVTSWSQESDL
uniref:Uncharacterized protein n=1 Tax=Rhizophora mucronata TaxID=61149 RepID=A0A2P2PNV6_RHIMU